MTELQTTEPLQLASIHTLAPDPSNASQQSHHEPAPPVPRLELDGIQAFAVATVVALISESMKRDAGVGEKPAGEKDKEAAKMNKMRDEDWEKWSIGIRESVEVGLLEMNSGERQRVDLLAKANAPVWQAVSLLRSAVIEPNQITTPHAPSTTEKSEPAMSKATKDPKPTNKAHSSSPQDHQDLRHTLVFHLLRMTIAHHKGYDSRTRTLHRHLLTALSLSPVPTLAHLESQLLHSMPHDYTTAAAQSKTRLRDANKITRWTKLGLAAVAGGAVVGITGGMAAPAVAGILAGWGLGSAITSAGAITAGFTGYGAVKGAEAVSHRDGDVTEFALQDVRVAAEATVTLGVSGWLQDIGDVNKPWDSLKRNERLGDVYALKWETEAQLKLGRALQKFVQGKLVAFAKKEILKRTVLVSLLGALWPLGILKYGYIIDNPFYNAVTRATKTGLVLADLLLSRPRPERPVTLVGYSLGARVIFVCLVELARRGGYGIVENVVLMGAPITPSRAEWRAAASVVSGRFVNAYSRNDWVLGFLYRAASVKVGVRIAGLEAVGAEFEGEGWMDGRSEWSKFKPNDDNDEEGEEEEKKTEVKEGEDGGIKRPRQEGEKDEKSVREVEDRVREKIKRGNERFGPIENVDLSSLIQGHLEYSQKMEAVLKMIGLDGMA